MVWAKMKQRKNSRLERQAATRHGRTSLPCPSAVAALGLSAVAALLGLSCDYNVDIQVKVPRWETGIMPIAVMGGHSVGPESVLGNSYSDEECTAGPQRFVLTVLIADERDRLVREGDRIKVGTRTLTLTRDLLLRPPQPTADPTPVELLNLTITVDASEPVAVAANVADVAFTRPPETREPRAVILHDHGQNMAGEDPADERIAAARELAAESLCHQLSDLECGLSDRLHVNILRLAESAVSESAASTRSFDEIVEALDRLQETVERGTAPLFGVRQGVTPGGGINEALFRCVEQNCWPAVMIMTADPDATGPWTLTDADPGLYADLPFPEGTAVLAANTHDNPALRLAACRTAGAFVKVDAPQQWRLETKPSPTSPVEYGFARMAVLAMQGRWQFLVEVTGGPPAGPQNLVTISGTLQVTLNDVARSDDFSFTVGGY
jgi:hypothetical protein